MKNFILLFVLFLSLAGWTSAQNAASSNLPFIEKKGWRYTVNGEKIKSRAQFKSILEQAGDAKVNRYFRPAEGIMITGAVCSVISGTLSLVSATSTKMSTETKSRLEKSSYGFVLGGLALVLIGGAEGRKAIRRYNGIAQGSIKAKPGHSFRLTPASDGLGLGMMYSFGR